MNTTRQNTRLGIALMIAAVFSFSVQDALSKHLAAAYNPLMVVMIRYWVYAVFVVMLALRRPGGLRRGVKTRHPWLHLTRATLLIAEICVIVTAYTLIGLINTHAVFAVCPLLIAGLSVPILGEKVGLGRWIAIAVGLAGVLVILQPGSGVFTPAALLPLASATMFAFYSLLTRRATQAEDAYLSLFWSGIFGAALITVVGLPHWEPMSGADWGWMAMYGLVAVFANWLLIRCYEVAEASAVQPFAYLQIVFVSIVGIVVFDETLASNVLIGVVIVVGAGLVALMLERKRGLPPVPESVA
ncbi:DMT family transporter [Tabrizicola sp. J26]|uniref:DMT family transporter n=1 Tax=Alitabrizicola rongguiensis TaxID=2909234 RepID=UPI001F180B47|nr:DMT family transporter [Tabrizicola rongguiensis]MCF1707727.1 DMT family transporter [Tabrizicola rongguiensis]